MTRRRRNLNFDWHFAPADDAALREPGFDHSGLEVVDLPHTLAVLPHAHADPAAYAYAGTYRRRLDVGGLRPGERAVLHVDGALLTADVYLDGTHLAHHAGGWTAFDVDLTDHLRDGRGTLAVVVDGTERPDVPPFGGVVDYLAFAGLTREVSLEILGPASVADVVVRAVGVLGPEPEVAVHVDVRVDPAVTDPLEAKVALVRDGAVVAEASAPVPGADDDGAHRLAVTLRPGPLALWGPGDPALYDIVTTLHRAGVEVDRLRTRTGFREAEFRPEGFFLNGERLVLRGLNRHQSFPYVGAAMPESAQRRDAEILVEELGVNIVRLSHYPQSPHFLDACDELGLLVLEELPGWQYIGDARWQARSVGDVEAMVRRDRNRACVVCWGVRINESRDDDDFYAATNAAAHRLDPTRPTGGVRNFAGSRLLEDVYTFNDFVHRGNNRALRAARDVAGQGVPYLVTEHNGHMFPTKSYDPEARRVEHALRHLRVLDATHAAADVAGAIGWCFADYPTHREFGSGDRICHHGVLDAFRIPKLAAAAYAAQQDEHPVLVAGSALVPGEFDASELRNLHVFTNCDEVTLLRDGEEVGRFRPDREEFPALPHPPVVIRDLAGTLIEKRLGISEFDGARLRALVTAALEQGPDALAEEHRKELTWLHERYGLTPEAALDAYAQLVAGWGQPAVRWEVVGYRGGREVARVARGSEGIGGLTAVPDARVLTERTTYDVTRIAVLHTDDAGTRQVYSDAVVQVEVTGPVRVLGPTTFALVGGARAVWVRTVGEPGEAVVRLRGGHLGSPEVRLVVRVERED